jgi:hypothetical protein
MTANMARNKAEPKRLPYMENLEAVDLETGF